jgi:hypothetical protein
VSTKAKARRRLMGAMETTDAPSVSNIIVALRDDLGEATLFKRSSIYSCNSNSQERDERASEHGGFLSTLLDLGSVLGSGGEG